MKILLCSGMLSRITKRRKKKKIKSSWRPREGQRLSRMSHTTSISKWLLIRLLMSSEIVLRLINSPFANSSRLRALNRTT